MVKEYKLTEERKKQLEEELMYLKTVREKEIADQIKEARSFGDLSENSEYDEAKNEQAKVYSRIIELENIISHSVLIDSESIVTDHVATGSLVRVLDLEFNEEEEYRVVGSQEANPNQGRISEESPFGRALMGKRAGDAVEVEAPAGILKYKILEILK